jgi:tetratricopeptide (TPR) repeat protein
MSAMLLFLRHPSFVITLVACLISCGRSVHAADQRWFRVSSEHFMLITDANDRTAHEVCIRFEQMRAVFGDLLSRNKVRMAEPMEIIAVSNNSDYAQITPLLNGQPITTPGFWLSGADRIFVVLNLSQPNSWRAVEYQIALYMLNYNYPPTPAWFDEGFAQYFASLNLTVKNTELGSDPAVNPGYQIAETTKPKSFTEILSSSAWMPWADLLTMKGHALAEQKNKALFEAQSWILLHYLLKQDKMSELGKYFGLVELQKLAVEQAIQQAFGMGLTQLDQSVKGYFHSIAPQLTAPATPRQPGTPALPQPLYQTALPFALEDMGTSAKPIPIPEAQALVDEMKLRIPERRQQAFDDLEKLIADEKTETVVAHRALAWAYVQRGETSKAFDELNDAVQISANDPWTRFGLALASYHSGEQGARVQGLANMMESLHIVINEYPDFAEAYNMLGWARLAGGGPNAAIESMKVAVQLAPRDDAYQLRLAQAYLEAKKFNDATAILDRLKQSDDAQVAHAAGKDLTDLAFIEKYGVPPEQPKETTKASPPTDSADNDDDTQAAAKSVSKEPTIDKRPVKFLKGTLVAVDCSKPPAAVLSVSQGGRTLKLKASDYNSVAIIGAPNFSCTWKGIPVNLNYRVSGTLSGDLVSIEIPGAGR